MMDAIIVAIITGIFALAGTVVTCRATMSRVQQRLQVHQAILETKLDTLANEVSKHNNFARRMPVVEEQIRVVNHRISDLEAYHK